MKFFKDFEQNSGGQPWYPTIQMTIDLRILIKFSLDFDQNSALRIRKLDDHGILMKF